MWESVKIEGFSPWTISIPIVVAIAFNALHLGRRLRFISRRATLAPRAWALLILAINLIITFQVIRVSASFDSSVTLRRGSGFYLMILAGGLMVVGSVVGVVAPQRASATSERASGSKPLTDAGSLDARRAGSSASVQTDNRERPPVPPPYSPDVAARLRQLKSLLDDELITQDEYDTRRTKILDAL
jgi:hypothetical protein